jgi:N-acetylneuraminic acid mutarotase
VSIARRSHITTVLGDGSALVTGGAGGSNSSETVYASAERYAAQANTWTTATAMTNPRHEHSASLLGNGKVLVAGGFGGTPNTLQNIGAVLASAELYDPVANTCTAVASLTTPRQSHSSVLLASGNVLVVGGYNNASSATFGVDTAELYDPVANTFGSAGSMVTLRQQSTLSALGDGRVMLVGGLPNLEGLPEFYR